MQITTHVNTWKNESAHIETSSWFFALLVLFITAFVFGFWRQYIYSGDDLQYAMVIETSVTGDVLYHPVDSQPFELNPKKAAPVIPINPRYALEWPTSILVVNLWKMFGWTGNIIDPVLSSRWFAGALGLAFYFLAIYRLTGSGWISGIVTAGIATSDSYWTYATHLDQTINMVASLCAAFFLLAGFVGRERFGRYGWLMAVLVLAALYNFTAVLTAGVFGLAVTVLRPQERSGLWQNLRAGFVPLVRFGVIYSLLVVSIVLLAIAIWYSPAALFSSDYWKSVTFQGHPEYWVDPVRDGVRAALGFAKGQITFPGADGALQDFWDRADTQARVSLAVFYLVVLGIMVAPVLFLLWRRNHLDERRRWLMWVILLWLVIYSIFNWIWDPGYIKYWIVPLLAWWALTALALDHLRRALPRWYPAALATILIFGAIGFGLNFTTKFLPQSDPHGNPWLEVSESLKQSDPKALFISSGHLVDFYVAFFARRDIIVPELIVYHMGGDTESAVQATKERIDQHLAVGGKIYVFGEEEKVNLMEEWFDQFGAELGAPAWEFPQLAIYELVWQ